MIEPPCSLMSQWCLQEFADIDLGDERRNRRFLQTASLLAQLPQAPISQACESKAAIKGAYRLFSHERCDRDEILRVHVLRTLERIREHPRVLIIQDTTTLEYNTHPKTQGLGRTGPLNRGAKGGGKGLISHTSLVVTPDGLPLGLLDQKTWARKSPQFDHVLKGKKESAKWLESLNQAQRLLPEGVQAITVADREADISQLLEAAVLQNMPFLVRAKDRTLKNSEHQWLRRHMENESIAFCYTVQVPIRESKRIQAKLGFRTAQVVVRFGSVQIRTGFDGGALPVYAILVNEDHPPEGSEAVSWILLTNVPTQSTQDALERVHWYQQRWHIENFHKVLKSGCTVEQSRLQEAERLDRYITLMSVIAWRLYWLTHAGRTRPENSCETVLGPEEWRLLYTRVHPNKPLPKTPPTLRQATHWIGRLGGFLGTKKYPEPGIITLWRGYQRLQDMVIGLKLAQHTATSG